MAKLPRFQPGQKITGADLNLLMAALDSGGVIDQASITNTGTTGTGLTATVPNVSGSTSPSPGSANSPLTPTGLTARSGIDNFAQSHTSFVVLSWTPNPVADFVSRYQVYWHKGSDFVYHNITVGGDVNSVRLNDVFPGVTYSFAVQANDSANRASLWSPELDVIISLDVDPPAVPSGLTATGATKGIYLKWTEVGPEGLSADLKEYQIAVSLDAGATYPTTQNVGPGNSYFYSYTSTNPSGAQAVVYFKIATVDWTGNVSDYSDPVSATVGGIDTGEITHSGALVGPITITPGGLTVSSGGITITGNSTITGTLTGLTGITSTGTISVPDNSFTLRKLLTTSGVDRASASGTWTTFATGGSGFVDMAGTPTVAPSISITPAVVSTIWIFWAVNFHTGGIAGANNNFRIQLDGTTNGDQLGIANPVSGYQMTVTGVDVFTGVTAAAHTFKLQVATTAGSSSVIADAGMYIRAIAIP